MHIQEWNIDNNIITYYIGKNAADNFHIIDISSATDIWFHIHNAPSEHVIAVIPDNIYKQKTTTSKRTLQKIIKQGALFCKIYSKYKKLSNVEICYAPINCIEKTDIVGQVNISDYKIIKI